MKYTQSMLKARPYLFFLASAAVAFAIVLMMETWDVKQQIEDTYVTRQGLVRPKMTPKSDLGLSRPLATQPEPLNGQELEWARTAWRYFENNTDANTGLVNSVHNYPSTTLWDTGSYLLAIVSAEALGVIGLEEAVERMEAALTNLAKLPLVEQQLPNKAYHVRKLNMVNYQNKTSEKGLGWSAIDIARIITAMRIAGHHFPGCSFKVNQILSSWDIGAMANDGVLIGTLYDSEGNLKRVQEGRIGYEQYAAKGAMLAGLNVLSAASIDRFAKFEEVQGVMMPADKRSHIKYEASTVTTSEPYILSGLEFGFDYEAADLSWRVLEAQRRRWEETGHLTAVSETHVRGAPHFLYASVIGNDDPWAVIAPNGKRYDDLRTFSTKAAFAWSVLFKTDYTERLLGYAATTAGPDGFYAGRFEKNGEINLALDANTNGVVLEALYYRVYGPLLHTARIKERYTRTLNAASPSQTAETAVPVTPADSGSGELALVQP